MCCLLLQPHVSSSQDALPLHTACCTELLTLVEHMSQGQLELSFQEIFPSELPAQCVHDSDPTKLKARASLTSQCLDMVHQTLDGCE